MDTMGLRERNKRDKLRRISAAARALFASGGYDGATLRDIAKNADVALGTLGIYAKNKSDLVLLIFTDDLSRLLAQGKAEGIYQGSLVQAFVAFFRPTYTAYGRELGLYRTLLRENVFHPASQHAVGFDRLRLETIGHLQALICSAQQTGEVKSTGDPALGARTAFLIFFAAVRSWIAAEQPDVEDGLHDLGLMYELLYSGLSGAILTSPVARS